MAESDAALRAIHVERTRTRLATASIDSRVTAAEVALHVAAIADIGTATLVGGTKTILSAAVTATCFIFLTHKGDGAAVAAIYENKSARSNGVSFEIDSLNVLDTGHIDWMIVEP